MTKPAPAIAGWVRLLHPGPSLLVTGCFLAAAAAAMHRAPTGAEAGRLIALMLPLQFAIGVVNDLCDLEADRLSRPAKPLVAGSVAVPVAVSVACLCSLVGLLAAASFSMATLAVAVGGWGAGMAYDLGLKRTAISWVPWWIGFSALPLCAWAAAHRLDPVRLAAIPLAFGLALGLHLANALPDIQGDALSGSTGLGVRLGADRSRRLSLSLVAATGIGAAVAAPWLGQSPAPVLVGAGAILAAVAATVAGHSRRPFPLLAAGAGILAALWLLAVP